MIRCLRSMMADEAVLHNRTLASEILDLGDFLDDHISVKVAVTGRAPFYELRSVKHAAVSFPEFVLQSPRDSVVTFFRAVYSFLEKSRGLVDFHSVIIPGSGHAGSGWRMEAHFDEEKMVSPQRDPCLCCEPMCPISRLV